MKYTLHINQIAAHSLGFLGKLDLIDLCLFDSFKSFANSTRCEKLVDEGGIWFWVAYNLIIEEMPFSGIKTKDGIYRRMLKLRDCGLIIFHPNNQKMTKTFFQWGENYDAMERTDWTDVPTDEKPEVGKDLRMKNRRCADEKPEVPTDEKPNNQTTNNQTTKKVKGAHAQNPEDKNPKEPGGEGRAFVPPQRGETIDDLEAPILEWAFGDGRESVRKWYADANRKCTEKDVRAMISKFCGVYATVGDEGKRERMLRKPLEFFKLSFKKFLKDQISFEAKEAVKTQQANGQNQEAVYSDPQIPVYRAKTLQP